MSLCESAKLTIELHRLGASLPQSDGLWSVLRGRAMLRGEWRGAAWQGFL